MKQDAIYYDSDIDMSLINDFQIGLIGYGNQGQAQALNLRDNGFNVAIGARKNGQAYQRAKVDGFEVFSLDYIASNCNLICLLLPDEIIKSAYEEHIEPYIGNCHFIFAHGFVVTNNLLRLPDTSDVILVAPTGPGRILRNLFLNGQSLPALIAVANDATTNAFNLALSYGCAIGCAKAGLIKTTFQEETVVDLFCEQAILCGGLPGLIKAGFNTLVSRGYNPILAYISCLKEVKLIADLMFTEGIDGMRQAISTTAKYGSFTTQDVIINENVRYKLNGILESIEKSEFSQNYLNSLATDLKDLQEWLKEEKQLPIVKTGKIVRENLNF